MAPHSSTLAWKSPWMEEPGRLWSMGSLRVGHDWATSLSLFTFMHWRRKWQPTPVFLPGESQGWRSLVGCRLWGRTEPDTAEAPWRQQQHGSRRKSGGKRHRRKTGMPLQGNYLNKVITESLSKTGPPHQTEEKMLLLAPEVQWHFGDVGAQFNWTHPNGPSSYGLTLSRTIFKLSHKRPSDSVRLDYLLIINPQDKVTFDVRLYRPWSYMQ